MAVSLRFLLVGLLSSAIFAFNAGNGSCNEMASGDAAPTEEAVTTPQGPVSYYYEFEDVSVPVEMKLDKSFKVETPTFKSGLQIFEGSVEPNSLADYYKNNLPRDGWLLRSMLHAQDILIVFEKPSKDCVIRISEGMFKTKLEIWMAPRASTKASMTPQVSPVSAYPSSPSAPAGRQPVFNERPLGQ